MTQDKLATERQERQREIRQAMDDMLAKELHDGWRLNTTWWIAVVGGSFVLVLLLLVLVTGG